MLSDGELFFPERFNEKNIKLDIYKNVKFEERCCENSGEWQIRMPLNSKKNHPKVC